MKQLAIAVTMLGIVVTKPDALTAQRRPYVLSPEYAASMEAIGGRLQWGLAVKTFTARLDLRAGQRVSPWIATGLVLLESNCIGQGCPTPRWLLLPGLRIDALEESTQSLVRPYAVAGIGATGRRGAVELLPSAGVGVRLANRGRLAPRLELRWERYADSNHTMLGLGVGFIVGSAVTAYRTPSK